MLRRQFQDIHTGAWSNLSICLTAFQVIWFVDLLAFLFSLPTEAIHPGHFQHCSDSPAAQSSLHSSGHSTASATAEGWARTQFAWQRNRHWGVMGTEGSQEQALRGHGHRDRHWGVISTMPLSPPFSRSTLSQLYTTRRAEGVRQ